MNLDIAEIGNSTLTGLMMDRASVFPGKRFLSAPGRDDLTFADLLHQAEEVSAQIRSLGVARSDTIALVLENGSDAATAFLTMAAAAVCAPLNPLLKHDELKALLTDMQARLVIVAQGVEHVVRSVAFELGITVAELCPLPTAGMFTLESNSIVRAADDSKAAPDDPALLLYTSGTTSRPKSVLLSHGNLVSGGRFTATAMRLSVDDLCLNVMPLYHAHGLNSTLLASLIAGAGVVCTSGFKIDAFFPLTMTYRPTWFSGVPAMHQAICGLIRENAGLVAGCNLRMIRSASSPLSMELMSELEAAFDCPVVEAYGMTEATSMVSANPLPPGIRKPKSVGISTGAVIAILGDDGTEMSPGTSGEIAIKGPNVFAGYGKTTEEMCDAFTNGFFRTGDWGYLDNAGYLFLTGRTKELINRGGSKVTPNEVDAVLLQHPDIASAACFGLPHPNLGEDVAAAVTLRMGAILRTEQIIQFVRDRLAEFKVPSRVFIVDDIPKTATGKIRRTQLAADMERKLAELRSAPAPTLDGDQSDVADIWHELLGQRPGPNDNFFDSGGNSILLTRLFEKLKERWGKPENIINLIDCPTPASQARMIFAKRTSAETTPPVETKDQGGTHRLRQRRHAMAAGAAQ